MMLRVEESDTTGNLARREVASASAGFDIVLPAECSAGGWALLQGMLIQRGGDYDARLYYDLGEGLIEDKFVEIPASGKGIINEVIYLPPDIRQMKLLLMGEPGEFELVELKVNKITTFESVWRMLRRILPMIFRHAAKKRKLIKLNFFQMVVDLQVTYKVAGKLRAHAAAPKYFNWIRQFDPLTVEDRSRIHACISRFERSPQFHLLILSDATNAHLVQRTLDSLNSQLYSHYSCAVMDATEGGAGFGDGQAGSIQRDIQYVISPLWNDWLVQFNHALSTEYADDWVMLLRAGDVLAPHALFRFACEALTIPEAAVLYSDDDEVDENKLRGRFRFKPDWSLSHIRATNFVGNAVVVRGTELSKAGGVRSECCRHGSYDLLLRTADLAGNTDCGKLVHIPSVLLHRNERLSTAGKNLHELEERIWNMAVLRSHLARNGAEAEVIETQPGCRRVRYRMPDEPPLVSIIVPTRDAVELTRRCVGSLLEKTTYKNFEILIVDNQSADCEALSYLEEIGKNQRVRVLRYDYPFNYSAINNMAVRESLGEAICLLNNDTEVITPDWLDEMIGHLMQPGVGIVGAKLYFPNGTIQHGGDLVGVGGVANHAHAYLDQNDPGYCNRAVVAQELSAVTAACMVTWRKLFQRLGGLGELSLPVSFNDVDYCLRVRAAGYRVVWTPHAELYHHESVSRGKDLTPEKKRRAAREAAYMRKRWKNELSSDPFYNPNLSYERPDFSLSHAPLVDNPWRN